MATPTDDPKAERAAAKVRRTAESTASDKPSEREKSQADKDIVEAHAELEQPKHYRGRPRPGNT
jgi:hypothetical protein